MNFSFTTPITTLMAAGLLLLAPASAATSTGAARLLVAEKDGRFVFLLPESHIGTPAQQDSYFKQIIRSAFAASSVVRVHVISHPIFVACKSAVRPNYSLADDRYVFLPPGRHRVDAQGGAYR